jgi:type IV secretion system protein TrbL
MRPSATTQALQTLIHGVLAGHSQMGEAASKLMWSLVTIEVVLVGLWTAFGEEQVSSLFKKLLGLGIWIWIIQSFPRIAHALVEGLATAALRAGGGGDDFSIMLDPSAIMARGLTTTEPFLEFVQAIPTINVGNKIVYYLCYLAVVWMYIWMGWCIFYPVVEYYIFVVLGTLLMPFAINRHTRFLADKAINMVVGSGIKLMVLGFLLALIQPVLAQIQFKNPAEWNELFSIMFSVGALGYLLYKAPQAAMSMVQGSPALSGSELVTGLGRVAFSTVMWAPTTAARYLGGEAMAGIGGAGAIAAGAGSSTSSGGGLAGSSASGPGSVVEASSLAFGAASSGSDKAPSERGNAKKPSDDGPGEGQAFS